MRRTRMIRNIRLGIANLLLHKLRAFLTMLGIVFGVASVIAMLSVGEGASRTALEEIRKLGSQNILVSSTKPLEDESAGAVRVHMSIYGLTYEDEARLRETFGSVSHVVPAKLLRKDARLGERRIEVRVVGTTPEWFELVERQALAGRSLVPADLEESRAVVVLTEHGARRLLAAEHTLGQTLRIGGEAFEVVGIIRSESATAGSIQTPDREIDAYIPLAVARERFGDTHVRRAAGAFVREYVELHQLIVKVERQEDVEPTAAALEAMLRRFHKRKDYRLDVPLALLRQAEQTKRTFNIVLGSIACISLLVGGIGIMNIMLASVTERTREIGIRRAIGATRRQIVSQFLVETSVLSTIGGAIGILLGLLIPSLITRFAGMATVVTPWSVALSLAISMGVGLVFGLYPAFRAAELEPIEALRHD